MDNLDEKILNLRKEQQKQEYSNIETGVYINNVLVKFKRTGVLDNKLTVLIPESFVDMPLAAAKIKYPSEQRPQCIKTSPDTSTNIALSLFDFPSSEKYLEQEAGQMQLVLKKTNPAIEFYTLETVELDDFKLAWMDYKSFAVDEQIYNIMFLAAVEGKTLHGVFNCIFRYYEDWNDPALQMIKSIQLSKEEDEEIA